LIKIEETFMRYRLPLPHIGLRTVKTTVAIVISMALVHIYGTTDSKYIFAMLGAMGAMENTFQDSLEACLTQLVGVAFGALVSLLLLQLPIPTVLQCIIGILLSITLYNSLRIRFSPTLPCMLIVMMCTGSGIHPIPYAISRFWDTAIGLAVGMLINTLVFPYDNSRRIRETVESLDRDVIDFLEEIFDGDSILPDPAVMIREIDELERQLQIFSRQRFLLNAKRQSRKLQQFRLCEANARQLVAHMEVLCHLEHPGILNEENRQQLLECGANIRDGRKLELFQECDIVANYHVAEVLRLRKALLEELK
jgi:uncharacterized membrane protein YgaE (UPF0421/DUF939 family)